MRLLIALTLLVGSLSVQASPDWLPSTPLLAQARVLDEQSFSGERRYPQSPLARISNRLRMEQSVTLSGEGQALYLQVPAQLGQAAWMSCVGICRGRVRKYCIGVGDAAVAPVACGPMGSLPTPG